MRTDTASKAATAPGQPAAPAKQRPGREGGTANTPRSEAQAGPAQAGPARSAPAVPARSAPAVPARSARRTPTRSPVWALVPGSEFAGGRYRLLERCGGSIGTAFWRALDTALGRDVALTVIEFPEGDSATGAVDLFARTGWLCRTRSEAAVAAILDMFEVDGRAVIVAQWKQGHALGLVRVGRPADAAASLAPLALVVREAHGAGASAALDHPGRVRIDSDGIAYLAFPGVSSDATARADVHGLGNVLCELLTGIRHAGDGPALAPSAVRPDVPGALSDLIVHAVGTDDLTADRVVEVLDATIAAAPPPPADSAPEPGVPAAFAAGAEQAPDRAGSLLATWGPFAAGGALLVVLAMVGWFVGVSLI